MSFFLQKVTKIISANANWNWSNNSFLKQHFSALDSIKIPIPWKLRVFITSLILLPNYQTKGCALRHRVTKWLLFQLEVIFVISNRKLDWKRQCAPTHTNKGKSGLEPTVESAGALITTQRRRWWRIENEWIWNKRKAETPRGQIMARCDKNAKRKRKFYALNNSPGALSSRAHTHTKVANKYAAGEREWKRIWLILLRLLERGWHRGVLLGWRRQWQQAGILAPPHSHTHLLFLVRDGNVQIILEIAVPKLLLCVALMCLFFWIHGCYIFSQFSLHSLCGFPKKWIMRRVWILTQSPEREREQSFCCGNFSYLLLIWKIEYNLWCAFFFNSLAYVVFWRYEIKTILSV
jgi:hypothetical protein